MSAEYICKGHQKEKSRIHWRIRVSLLVTALLVVASCGGNGSEITSTPPAEAEVQSVKFLNNANAPLVALAAAEKGFFEAAGVEVEFAEIETGTEAIAAMIGGSFDLVTAADARLVQSADSDLPIVAIGIHNTGFLGNLLVRADSDISTMDDLVGKRIGLQVGSGVHTTWLRYLDGVQLTEDDFEVVNLAVPDMAAALEGNSVDAALMWQPHAGRAEEVGIAKTIMNTFDISEPVGIIYPFYLITTREMIESRPQAVQQFMNAWVCTQQWIGENPEEAIDVLAGAFEGVSRSVVEASFNEHRYDVHQVIDDEVKADTIAQAEKLVEVGALEDVPDMEPYFDASFAQKALDGGCS